MKPFRKHVAIAVDGGGIKDDVSNIPELTAYGDELGRKILNDETDPVLVVQDKCWALEIKASRAPRGR